MVVKRNIAGCKVEPAVFFFCMTIDKSKEKSKKKYFSQNVNMCTYAKVYKFKTV